jgi:DNA-binding NarL/FixJ family response regulator
MGIGLRRVGHTIEAAATIAQARGGSSRFDVGVFDLELPDGSGLELAVELIGSGRVQGAVFFTACRDPEILEDAERFGLVVPKDGTLQRLVDAVAQACNDLKRQARPAALVVNGPATTPGASGRSGTRRRVPG